MLAHTRGRLGGILMARRNGQWVKERQRSQERKQWDNETTELADMCFDLETKDGLSEGERYVLADSTTTMKGYRYEDRGTEEAKRESMGNCI